MIPASTRSSVDLPEPLRPIRPTASPGAISADTSRSAQTSSPPVRPRATNRSLSVRVSRAWTRKRRETPAAEIAPGVIALSFPTATARSSSRPGTASRTSAARRVSVSGSTEGKTPWPRLKMWPGRPPARARMSRASASTTGHGASSTAGSRLPCTARSGTFAQPVSSGIRQSSPITSPPAAAISSSRVAVPVPKWIVGTSTAARTRAECGATCSR